MLRSDRPSNENLEDGLRSVEAQLQELATPDSALSALAIVATSIARIALERLRASKARSE